LCKSIYNKNEKWTEKPKGGADLSLRIWIPGVDSRDPCLRLQERQNKQNDKQENEKPTKQGAV